MTARPPNVGDTLAERVAAFSDEVRPATKAVPHQVPEARKTGESLERYTQRAQDVAIAAAAPLRKLVLGELEWLEKLDVAPCPAADGYRAILNAYWITAGAVWSAHYAPDPALLEQALADLDDLNAAVAAAAPLLSAAPEACRSGFEIDAGVLSSRVIGTQSIDIVRDPAGLHESSMGNLVADAMRLRYPGVDAALLNSGGLRADLIAGQPSVAEQAGEITLGEMLMVLPFGNRAVIVTVTGDQLEAALLNGFAPACDPGFKAGTFRFPQLSGLKARFHCDGLKPVVDGMWKTPGGAGGPELPIGPADTVRVVTVDYLPAGGDGYSMLGAGTNIQEPGNALLDIAIDYVAAHSPVGRAVEGRIVGP